MRRTLRLILSGLLVGTGTGVGFEVGGHTGFNEGYRAAMRMYDQLTGAEVAAALMALEKGDIDQARHVLEGDDSVIIQISALSHFSPALHSFAPSWQLDSAPLLKRIAEYRQSHPSNDHILNEANVWFLARYGTGASSFTCGRCSRS